VPSLNALDRHLALIGFMGAGKSTLGPVLAERLGRRFVNLDEEIEGRTGTTIGEIFASRGEPEFRSLEAQAAAALLVGGAPGVLELGGGAIGSPETREAR
jgi:shikimate kinase